MCVSVVSIVVRSLGQAVRDGMLTLQVPRRQTLLNANLPDDVAAGVLMGAIRKQLAVGLSNVLVRLVEFLADPYDELPESLEVFGPTTLFSWRAWVLS